MGACRDFDGINDRIDFGNDPTFVGDSEVTIITWINIVDNTVVNNFFGGKWSAAQKPLFIGVQGTNKFAVSIGDGNNGNQRVIGSTNTFSTFVSNDTWTNISATNSLTTTSGSKMYINGLEETSSIIFTNTTQSSIQSNTSTYSTGDIGSSTNFPMEGLLSYFSIFDTRLSQAAINEIQYNPFAFIAKSLIPHWDAGSTEAEIGNGLTGTVTGALENFDGPPVFLLGGQ